MKRNFKLLVAVVALIVMVFTFASCDIIDAIKPHEHKFSVEWSYDETNHWHAALCEDGEECSSAIADLAAHTFVEGVCSVCDCKEPEPPHTHNFVDGKCECGESDPNYQPPHEHSYGEGVVTTEPTCTEKGVKTFTCSCGDSYTEDIDALGHTYADGKCECGAIDPDHEHKYADGKCTICGAECAEHAYSQEKEDATCTEDGWTKKTCTICGYTTETTIPAYGHDETKVEGKEPTCTSTGLSEGKVCSVCNEVLVEQIVLNKAEHKFVEGVCSACGEVDPEYNGPKTYYLMSEVPNIEEKTLTDGQICNYGFFTLHGTAKLKTQDNAKKFADGFESTRRIHYGGKSDLDFNVENEEGETVSTYMKNVIEFTIPDGYTAVVTIWWGVGDVDRQVGLYNANLELVAQTNVNEGDENGVAGGNEGDGIKNDLFVNSFEISESGKYYIGNIGGNNYHYEVAVVVTPVEEVEDPTKGSINVTTTDNNTWIDEVTFTAGGEGNYTFTLPAGLGAWDVTDCDSFPSVIGPYVDYYNNTDGGQFTVGLEAGATLRFYIASEEKKDWVIEWSYEAGEVEDDEPVTPPEGDATQLVVGSNTVVFADGELSEGKTYPFVVTEEGTYTFKSDLMAVVMDAEGNSIGMGQVSLTAGTYSVTLFSMMPMPANSFTVNITYEAPSSGEDSEPDGSEQNPYIWETLPESVVLDYDVISGKVYYIFTATADGSVTFTWPVEYDSWYDIFELDADGNLTSNNASGRQATSHSFVVEAGKSYRVSLGSWAEEGSHTITIAFSACDHEWSEATCLVLSTCSKCGATTGDYADHIPNSENPTCADPAECTVCGKEVGYVPHSWNDGEVITPADCSTETNGVMKLTCTVCGATQEEEIWAFHDMVVDEEVYATCTEDGHYKAHCSVCGYIEEYVNEAQGHYNWYASCGDTTNCMECGAEFTIEHSGSPATCTEPMYCYNCWQYVGEPAGHKYTYPCDKVCCVCYEETNPNATHTIVHVEAKAATCYENGNIEHWYCSDCGTAWADEAQTQLTNLKNVVLPAGHTNLVHFEAIEPGCHYDGNIEYWVCYGCEIVWQDEALTQLTNIKNVVLPATGYPTTYHAAIEPGCHTEGQIEHWTCSQCEQVWADEALTQLTNIKNVILPATGEGGNIRHIPGVEVTCETIGQHEHWICTTCGQAWTDEALTQLIDMKDVSIPALGHEIVVDEAVDPTCTETGLTEGSHCSRCDDKTIAQEVVPALGHTEGDAATCTSAQICTVCKIELVAALGHADEDGNFKCDVCSAKMLPADGSTLTIEQALIIAKMQSHNTYTTQKYYITGIVTNVYNTQYGNFYIKDADGNQLCIYGLYMNGTRYDKMEYKPVEGDEVTVYGPLGAYNTTYQIKNAELDEVIAHEHDYQSVVTEATCTTDGYTTHTCSICRDSYVDSEVEALGHTTDSGICENCGKEIGGEAVVETLATFEFGANGSAAHVDGNDLGASKSYTAGSYTLNLTGMSKVYGPAYDAKGNSCIKLGTSSVIGTFKFTVPDNVTEVVIYVAKYKSNTTKINVNGTAYTISGASNNGAYDVITIDTSVTKTVSFTTVSGGARCMINSIVFNGYAQ